MVHKMDLSPRTAQSSFILLRSTHSPLLLGRADLDLLGVGTVLLSLRSWPDRAIFLVVHRLANPIRGTEELVHRLECHSLFARKSVTILHKFGEEGPTLVSGTRNQTKMNMEKQKQENAMKAP
jgi:hypothetical protein